MLALDDNVPSSRHEPLRRVFQTRLPRQRGYREIDHTCSSARSSLSDKEGPVMYSITRLGPVEGDGGAAKSDGDVVGRAPRRKEAARRKL